MTRRNYDLPKTQAELDALVAWANEATQRDFRMTCSARRAGALVTLWETLRSWNGMGSDEIAWGNVDHVFFVLCARLQQELGR